jgi:hypothetical protein
VAGDDDPSDGCILLGRVTPSVPLRVPRPGRSELESRLAEVNDHARRQALVRLTIALPGIDVATLAQTADGAGVAVGRWDGPGSVTEQPLDDDALSVALAAAVGPGPALLVDADHERAAPRDRDAIRQALDEGWTLMVGPAPSLHDGLPGLVDDLSRAFGTTVATEAEVATTSSRGASPRLGRFDMLTVQLVGSQQRFVRRPVQLSPDPLVPESAELVAGPELDCAPGSARYLPRGWAELRIGREEVSISVELAICRPTVVDVLHQLADLAGARPLLRADVPFDAELPHASFAGSVMADPNLWTAEFGGLVDWPGFDQALATLRARVLKTAVEGRSPVPGGIMLGPVGDGRAVVAAGDEVVAVDATSTDAVLDRLRRRGWVTGDG